MPYSMRTVCSVAQPGVGMADASREDGIDVTCREEAPAGSGEVVGRRGGTDSERS